MLFFTIFSFSSSIFLGISIYELSLLTSLLPLNLVLIATLLSGSIDFSIDLPRWRAMAVKWALLMMPLCALCPIAFAQSFLAPAAFEAVAFFVCAYLIAFCDIS